MVDLYTDDDLEGCMKPAMKLCYNRKCSKSDRCRRFAHPLDDFVGAVEVLADHGKLADSCQAYYPKYYEKDKKWQA